jgi:glutamyl-tRNA reductase
LRKEKGNTKEIFMTDGNISLIVAGVSFRKTTLEIRNKFALTSEHIKRIYADGSGKYPKDFFILSTCNRTEIYGRGANAEMLINLLAENTIATPEEISEYVFIKTGDEAAKHLFRVAAGMDSQILGDYEIIGQMKNAFNLAKTHGCISGYMEKLFNSALQSSRQVKSRTALSDGTTSVSYAVIQLLKEAIGAEASMNVCLMGLGKIGTLTLKNLKHYLPQHQVTVLNRNESKAELAAGEFDVNFAPFENQQDVFQNADVLIVATGAEQAIVSKKDLAGSKLKLIFDLSVPSNVHPDVKEIEGLQHYNIDELSAIVNQAIEARRSEIPVAEAIIDEHFAEFRQWEQRRAWYTQPVAEVRDVPAYKVA